MGDQDGNTLFVKMLAPTDASPASFQFTIPAGVTSLRAYEFCNKHGLYGGPLVSVSGGIGVHTCSVDTAHMVGQNDASAQSIVAEMNRRQSSIFESDVPFT